VYCEFGIRNARCDFNDSSLRLRRSQADESQNFFWKDTTMKKFAIGFALVLGFISMAVNNNAEAARRPHYGRMHFVHHDSPSVSHGHNL
tara:strand:+ start:820 stop:1086 length:267 start_codon:yes stop_codon:yes gene_type:complete